MESLSIYTHDTLVSVDHKSHGTNGDYNQDYIALIKNQVML